MVGTTDKREQNMLHSKKAERLQVNLLPGFMPKFLRKILRGLLPPLILTLVFNSVSTLERTFWRVLWIFSSFFFNTWLLICVIFTKKRIFSFNNLLFLYQNFTCFFQLLIGKAYIYWTENLSRKKNQKNTIYEKS